MIAKTAAKLVMFPEEELIPFFKDSKLDDINDDIFKQTIDSMMNDDGSKEEKTEEPQENHEEVKEDSKVEEAKEDEAVVLEEKEDTLNVLDNDEVFTDDFKLDEENAPISLDELDHTFDNPLEETAVTETSEKEETKKTEEVTSDKLSEEEAKLISGIEDIKEASQYIVNLGCENLMVTLGKEGTLLSNREKQILIKTKEVKMKDATGAGDAFIGAVIAQILNEPGKSMEKIVEMANLVGGITTTKLGALESIPTWDEVFAYN